MQRKRKAEMKFNNLLEKAIMTYADKAPIAYPNQEPKDINCFTPPITHLIFTLVYNFKMLEFLTQKYEYKK